MWRLDGDPIPTLADVSFDHQSLSIAVLVDGADIESWRTRYQHAGSVDVIALADGGYRALPTTSATNAITVDVRASPADRPPFPSPTEPYLVTSYSDRQLAHDDRLDGVRGRTYEVSLGLQRRTHRTDGVVLDESGGVYGELYGDDYGDVPPPWRLRVGDAILGFDDVVAKPMAPESGTDARRLELVCTGAQAEAVAVGLARVDAVSVHEIRDGASLAEDWTHDADAANTVRLRTPDGADLPDGQYVALEWGVERLTPGVVEDGDAVYGEAYGATYDDVAVVEPGAWLVECDVALSDRATERGQVGGALVGRYNVGYSST